MICGVDDNSIIEDYSKSENLLGPDMTEYINVAKNMGFSEEFARSEPHTMENTLAFIKTTYGSIDSYLESINISSKKIIKVKQNLMG